VRSSLAAAWRSSRSFLYGGVVNEFVLIWRFKKLPEPIIVLVAAAVGLFVYPLMKF
jgi:hypothetical protein